MDFIKKIWPTAFQVTKSDVKSFVIQLLLFIVVCGVAGWLVGLLGFIPIIGWIFGLVRWIIGVYGLVGVVLCILVFLGVL